MEKTGGFRQGYPPKAVVSAIDLNKENLKTNDLNKSRKPQELTEAQKAVKKQKMKEVYAQNQRILEQMKTQIEQLTRGSEEDNATIKELNSVVQEQQVVIQEQQVVIQKQDEKIKKLEQDTNK